MQERILKDGKKVPELERPVDLIIHTRCPAKWKLIDMETGEEYTGTAPYEHNMMWRKNFNA
jgi:hypothetical protein